MKKELLDKISLEQLNAYLDGSLCKEETEQIDSLLDQSQEFQLLVDEYIATQMEINNEQNKPTKLKKKVYWYYAAAVVACLVLIGGCYITVSHNPTTSQSQISTYSIQSQDKSQPITNDRIDRGDSISHHKSNKK